MKLQKQGLKQRITGLAGLSALVPVIYYLLIIPFHLHWIWQGTGGVVALLLALGMGRRIGSGIQQDLDRLQRELAPLSGQSPEQSAQPHGIQDPTVARLAEQLSALVSRYLKLYDNLNSLPTPVMEIDADYNVVFLNQAGGEFVGRSAAGCIGSKCYSLFNTDDCQSENCALYQAMRDGEQRSRETRANPRTGDNIPVAYSGIPVRGENGAIQGALEFVADISFVYAIVDEIKKLTPSLSAAAEQLSAVSAQMAASSEQMAAQSQGVSSATEQITASVDTVSSAAEQSSSVVSDIADKVNRISEGISGIASAVEEMNASFGEVDTSTAKAKRISQQAIEQAEHITAQIGELSESSKQIGKVVGLIKDIAEQTNMLALNAAIEAAGAGEAGKGFAVVAGEVKELAKQSADATSEISDQIETIQNRIQASVEAIGQINGIIGEIADINTVIASSVREQTAASNDISRTMSQQAEQSHDLAQNIADISKGSYEIARSSNEVAAGVQDISRNIQGLDQAVSQVAAGSSQTNQSAEELADMANSLDNLVSKFNL